MTDDAELLRRYAEERSEDAFAEIVQRHVGLVYTVALRKVSGDPSLAEEVTQEVFCGLARKASEVAGRGVLVGWLFTGARYAAAKAVRSAQRRRIHEQEAHIMHETTAETAAVIDWERLRPALDDLIGELSERDREAVLLRFFAAHDFPEIGSRIGLSAEGARARVNRALDQLQVKLKRRGITSTTAALAAALVGHAGIAAPAGLAAGVTKAAMLQVAASATAGVATFMNIKTGIVWIGGVLATVGVVGGVTQWRGNARLQNGVTTRATAGPETQTAAQSTRTVTVLGAVGKPGMVAFPPKEGLTLVDAITRAGGFTELADKRKVSLRRTQPDGSTSSFTINAEGFLKGQTADAWPLQPSDVIYVPELLL